MCQQGMFLRSPVIFDGFFLAGCLVNRANLIFLRLMFCSISWNQIHLRISVTSEIRLRLYDLMGEGLFIKWS